MKKNFSIKEAISELRKYCRCSISVEFAKRLMKPFGCELPEKLILKAGDTGYREIVYKDTDRVDVSRLACEILEQKGLIDKADFSLANALHGIGRIHEEETEACCKVLEKEYEVKE